MSLFPNSFLPQGIVVASGASIFCLVHTAKATEAKTIILLHGYPQNHTLWHEFASHLSTELLDKTNIIIPDLPGYGQSKKACTPDTDLAHSKRAVAADIVDLVGKLFGNVKFAINGHDRGARIGYRLARDFPDRVTGLCVQDIVPTQIVFDAMNSKTGNHQETFKSSHWIFLACPSPLPETLIGASSDFYISHTINSWTGSRYKGKLNELAMKSWIEQYRDPDNILGSLEDYRAGASIDLVHDAEDEGLVKVPLLVLYSIHLGHRFDVEKIWKGLASSSFEAKEIGDGSTGHFLPVEAVKETTEVILNWLNRL